MAWYVYMVRCSDNTLYTGITTDVERRVAEHNGEANGKGAKYTAARRPVTLVYTKRTKDKSKASQEEYRLRTLSRSQKELLIV
ncbi:endonuclease [bacterium]|nr:endonuclease [bacterium]|tara:strand:- start:5303 stop:5551 length:249 start_codon:yes stop_codon:yes gene_type:complete